MPGWERIEDVPDSELPPLLPVPPAQDAGKPAEPPDASVSGGGKSYAADAGSPDTTLLSILNVLNRIEQMLHQMTS